MWPASAALLRCCRTIAATTFSMLLSVKPQQIDLLLLGYVPYILQAVAGVRSSEYAAGLSSGATLLLRPYTAAPLRLSSERKHECVAACPSTCSLQAVASVRCLEYAAGLSSGVTLLLQFAADMSAIQIILKKIEYFILNRNRLTGHRLCILQAVAGVRSLEFAAGLGSGVTALPQIDATVCLLRK